MALVGPDNNGSFVVRATHRLAEQLKAPWIAVTVETPEQSVRTGGGVNEAIALAQSLGSRGERLVDADVPAPSCATRARAMSHRSSSDARAAAGGRRFCTARSRKSWSAAVKVSPFTSSPPTGKPSAAGFSLAAMVVGLAHHRHGDRQCRCSGCARMAVPSLGEPSIIGMLLLAAVLLSAAQGGFAASVFAALLAFLSYNFFFTEPHYTFAVKDWRNVLELFVFLAVAVTAGTLAGRTRDQALAARGRMAALQTLFDFARRLSGTVDMVDLTHAIVLQAHRLTEKPTMLLLPEGWRLDDPLFLAAGGHARHVELGRRTLGHIHGEPAGRGTGTLPSATWYFLPLKTTRGTVGVFGVAMGSGLNPEVAQTLDAILDLSAVALERVALVAGASRAEALAETERLRSALLSSISHDLRTPLTAILGSVTGPARDPGSVRRRRTRRFVGNDSRRGRAPRPLRPQPPRHDQGRVRSSRLQTRMVLGQ